MCRKGLNVELNFRLCGVELETTDHVFRRCSFVVGIWTCVGRCFGVYLDEKNDLGDWLFSNVNKKAWVSHGFHWVSLFPLLL